MAKEATRIAFGSCSKHDYPQPIWSAVEEYGPDVWVWLGDIIYGDVKQPDGTFRVDDTKNVQNKFVAQYNRPDYSRIRQNDSVDIVGVWDDHDYGINDGGRNHAAKDQVKDILLDFLDEPVDSERRKRQGVYEAYTYGDIRLILLDNRYFRQEYSEFDLEDGGETLLGEQQWQWLEQELCSPATKQAKLVLIGSGTSVLVGYRYRPVQAMTGSKFLSESWSMFPGEKERLMELIHATNTSGAILLSGDIHIGELVRADDCISYPLYELTSSGMTHTIPREIASAFSGVKRWMEPRWWATVLSNVLTRVGEFCGPKVYSQQIYGGLNFGAVSLDSEHDTVSLEIRNQYGIVTAEQRIHLADLQSNPDARIAKCAAGRKTWWNLNSWAIKFAFVLFCFFSMMFYSIRVTWARLHSSK